MAFPTAVNSQVTDSVTQANVQVIADAPAMAMGSLYQSMAHSMGLAYENAVAQQQNANSLGQAVVTKCVSSLIG
ncbi:RebB family R body protein [Pseudotenacibaculum haliotis]|uniref:RebB family R body protein n=1 Tax=Pseudotenacibaculum haliotis TaxID=1862138 RepID=A0ABW5LYQ7_9FLAO